MKRRAIPTFAALAAAAMLLGACAANPSNPVNHNPVKQEPDGSKLPTKISAPTSTTPTPEPIQIGAVTATHGLKAMQPQDEIDVAVTNGKLTQVVATDSTGAKLEGTVTGSKWRPNRPFLVRQTYTLDIEATGQDGTPVHSQAKATTVNPELVAEVDFLYNEGAGNGMPIWVRFDMPVTGQDQRVAIMKAASITTVPAQEGSWGWADEHTLYWRPKNYWQPGSTAHVEVKAAGLPAGNTWILKDVSADYQYGDLRVIKADINAHTLTATRNGEVVRTLAASFGEPGQETLTGTKLIMNKEQEVIMDSSTYGRPVDSPGGYRLNVKLAQRVTWSGEYIHAAPWADAAHGNSNVSNGCTGLSDADALWMFNFDQIGDPVEFSGPNNPVQAWDTIGVWTYSWADWQSFADGRLSAPK